MKSIAVIVKTNGLEYDDRVRKVSIALSTKFQVKIFVLLDSNIESEGRTSYGIEFESIRLKSRTAFPSAKFLALKMSEFYFRLRKKLKSYDYIWANDESTFIFPLMARKNTFVWDLHEIPTILLNGYRKRLFHIIEKKSLKILHANPERIRYLFDNSVIKILERHDYIHNYPDEKFINSDEVPTIFDEFKIWLSGGEYVYIQGIFGKARFPYNTLVSVIERTQLKIIVVGRVDTESLEILVSKYGEIFQQRVFLAGMVDQLSLPVLLKNAKFTVVLYETSKPNNKYCEANRLYQAISLGIPVIVGNNETMANVVKQKFGVVMKTDGRDLEELKEAISTLDEKYDIYKSNCALHSNDYIWKDRFVKLTWLRE